jgi:MtN3 and saliva related transmembrane protein
VKGTTLLGIAAGSLTTLALIPQVVRIWRSRSAEDVSGATFAVMGAGIALWIVYGVRIGSAPVIVFNAVSLVLAAAILALKARYKGR